MSANRDGDSRSWVLATVDEFEGRLTRYAIRLLGDEHSARDVVQHTFLRLCDAVPGEVQSHIGPWLFRVCRNRSLDMLRKNGRVRAIARSGIGSSGHCRTTGLGALDLPIAGRTSHQSTRSYRVVVERF